MTASASNRLYLRRLWMAVLTGSLATGIGSNIGSAASTDQATVGAWQAHRYQFQYLGTNTTYSCSGLADKLRLLLDTVDAREVHVNPVCLGNPGLPDRFAQADMRFETLTPEGEGATTTGAAATTPGVWQHVEWTKERPRTLGPGDCAMIQQLLGRLIPMLATRNLQTKFDCVQNHDYGSFHVSFDAFVPASTSK
jgi:hypothetical protein